MINNDDFVLKPIRFSSVNYLGNTGDDLLEIDYKLTSLISQNILYLCYYQAKTIDELAESLGMPRNIIKDEVNYLEERGLLECRNKNAECKNNPPPSHPVTQASRGGQRKEDRFQTNILIHDFTDEVYKQRQKIFRKYAKKVCEIYVKLIELQVTSYKLLEAPPSPPRCASFTGGATPNSELRTPNSEFYTPENDTNFLLWTLITFAISHKFRIIGSQKKSPFIKTGIRGLHGIDNKKRDYIPVAIMGKRELQITNHISQITNTPPFPPRFASFTGGANRNSEPRPPTSEFYVPDINSSLNEMEYNFEYNKKIQLKLWFCNTIFDDRTKEYWRIFQNQDIYKFCQYMVSKSPIKDDSLKILYDSGLVVAKEELQIVNNAENKAEMRNENAEIPPPAPSINVGGVIPSAARLHRVDCFGGNSSKEPRNDGGGGADRICKYDSVQNLNRGAS